VLEGPRVTHIERVVELVLSRPKMDAEPRLHCLGERGLQWRWVCKRSEEMGNGSTLFKLGTFPQKPASTVRPFASLRIQSGWAAARAECLSMAAGASQTLRKAAEEERG
jgi:hypothetical protein